MQRARRHVHIGGGVGVSHQPVHAEIGEAIGKIDAHGMALAGEKAAVPEIDPRLNTQDLAGGAGRGKCLVATPCAYYAAPSGVSITEFESVALPWPIGLSAHVA